ncbi:MAG: DNA primase small subunit PriS [Candidatus Bathyarchaeia archaeon]
MDLKLANFVKKLFYSYYVADFSAHKMPSEIKKREFGFVSFDGSMMRHMSFNATEELTTFIKNFVPKDAYFSCAYYENPTEEMDRKDWLGADLIFDIDADHIPTTCEKIHDKWTCKNCGFSGKGVTPEKCPLCAGEKIDAETWPCEVCLNSAKSETIKLLDMLQSDFGFSRNEMQVFFSGHRGYHVHVECEVVKSLDSTARKEIADYVSSIGIEASFHLVGKSSKGKITYGNGLLFNCGWPKRLAEGIQTFLSGAKEEDLRELGFRKKIITALMEKSDKILKSDLKGVGPKTWEKLVKHVIASQSVKIDTVVTTDIHRLIRIPETLNSRTGFKKAEVPISTIDKFEPFRDAIAFRKGSVKVRVSDAPEFRINDETFGPYRDRKIELPVAAALLLVCRGRAEVLNGV